MAYETRLRLVSESSVNVSNNTSYVTVVLEFRRTDYQYYGFNLDGNAYWNMTVDGQSTGDINFTFNWTVPQNAWKEVGRRGFTITHNADGSKSINMSGTIYFGSGVSPGTLSGSGSATLTTIPRASSFGTINGSTIGSQISVAVKAASSSFTHKFWYRVGGSGWIESPLTFTPPLSLCAQVPNATSATMELCLRTMNGSTIIGSDVYKNITVYVPASVVPSISAVNITEAVSGLNAQFGAYVQSKSKLRVKTTSAGAQGSTIKTVRVNVQNSSYYGSDITTGVLTQSGTITVSVTVTDSRGRTATSAPTVTVVAYYAIKINGFTAKRCNADGTANDGGTALSIRSKYDIARVGSKNIGVYKIEIQEKGATSWTTLKNESNENDHYSYDGTLTTAVNTAAVDKAYTLKLTVTDYFGSAAAFAEVGTVFRIINVNTTKKGIAFGKFSEKDAFECNMPAEFLQDVNMHSKKIINLAAPTANTDATNKKYVDDLAGVRRELGNTENLNDLVAPGIYIQYANANTSTARNYPVALAGNLEVLYDTRSTFVWQRYSVYDNRGVYIRTYYNGTWYSWKLLADQNWVNDLINANKVTVQTGTNYTAIKYPNGTMQLTQTVNPPIPVFTSAWGSLYESNPITLGNWAVPFKSTPTPISIFNDTTTGTWFEGWKTYPTATNAGTVYFVRGTKSTDNGVEIIITAIGKWK